MRNEERGIMVSPCGDDFLKGRPLVARMVCINPNLAAPRNGLSRAPAPTNIRASPAAAKSLSLFADFTPYKDIA